MNDNLPDKKEYKKYKYKLTPFKLCVLQNFPFIEADFDAITNYQLLCKVVEYLNHVIDNQNTVEENFKIMSDNLNTLYNFLDNLDLQDEVNNKLDEMASDGRLETIISSILNATNGNLICNLEYRDCTEWIENVTEESEQNPIIGYAQGMTTTPTSFIIAYQTGGSYQNKTNKILLREINKSTHSIIKEAWLELGHANSIAYNDTNKEIYVAVLYERDNEYNPVYTNDIIIVDYNTFTIKNRITPNIPSSQYYINSVSYDNKNNVLAIANSQSLYIMDDFDTINTIINFNLNFTAPNTNILTNNTSLQTSILFDNKIYMTKFWSNGVAVFDLNGNIIKNYYNFDIDVPIEMGELESVAVEENGNIYFISVEEVISANRVAKLYDVTIFKSNLIYNGYKNYYYSGVTTAGVGYYVDATTSNKIQAGTNNYPFKHIEQAIMASEFQERNVNVTINLKGTNQDYGFILSKSSAKLNILCNNNFVHFLDFQETSAKIEKLTVDATTEVNINNINNPTNIHIFNHSNIKFIECSFINNDTKKDYCMVSKYSNINLWECTFDNFTNIFYMENFSNISGSSFHVTNCDYYYYNQANCNFYINTNNLLTYQNPNSLKTNNLPSIWQNIPYTFENGTLTFNDILLDTINSPYRKLQATIESSINNTIYRSIIEFATSPDQPRCSISFMDGSNTHKYDVFFLILKSSQGVYTITQKVLDTTIANNTITNITTNSSFNITKLKRL